MTAPTPLDAFDPRPVVLEGGQVRLEPLARTHAGDLLEAGRDESLWRYSPGEPFTAPADVDRWIAAARAEMEAGRQIAFAVIDSRRARALDACDPRPVVRSQRAIERIGATREGVHRRHLIMSDGFVRDSVYYSITDLDWPRVKPHLETLLDVS